MATGDRERQAELARTHRRVVGGVGLLDHALDLKGREGLDPATSGERIRRVAVPNPQADERREGPWMENANPLRILWGLHTSSRRGLECDILPTLDEVPPTRALGSVRKSDRDTWFTVRHDSPFLYVEGPLRIVAQTKNRPPHMRQTVNRVLTPASSRPPIFEEFVPPRQD